MREPSRLDEIIMLLVAYALGEVDLPNRLMAALKLLDLGVGDAPPPPDGGEAVPALADDQAVLTFPSRFAA